MERKGRRVGIDLVAEGLVIVGRKALKTGRNSVFLTHFRLFSDAFWRACFEPSDDSFALKSGVRGGADCCQGEFGNS